MSSTTFATGTLIVADWLNDVNTVAYTYFGNGSILNTPSKLKIGSIGVGVTSSGLGLVVNPGNILGITGAGTTNTTIVAQDATTNIALDVRNSGTGASIFSIANNGPVTVATNIITPKLQSSDAVSGVSLGLAGGFNRIDWSGTGIRILNTLDAFGTVTGSTLTANTSVVTPLVQTTTDTPVVIGINSVPRWTFDFAGGGYRLYPSFTTNTQDLGATTALIRIGYFGTSIFTPRLQHDTDITIGNTGVPNQWVFDSGNTARLSPATARDNLQDFGQATARIRTGYFGTSVVTPLVAASSGDLTLQTAGTIRQLIWSAANNNFAPASPADLGTATLRWGTLFAPIIDSGTTGSLSLKTNNGTEQFRIVNVASAVNLLSVQGGATGVVPSFIVLGETTTGLDLYTRGVGSYSFRSDVAGTAGTAGAIQFQIVPVASATRNITVTGSNGGNPTIGVTAGSLAISAAVVGASSILSSSPSAGVGYATGAGGTVTQLTSKTTGVTLNTITGQITMNGAALAANAEVQFTVTNSVMNSTQVVIVNHITGGTFGAYSVQARAGASMVISVRNVSAGSLSEAIVLQFLVLQSSNA